VRSDAKALSAGSTSGQAQSRGSFARGAFAIRGGSSGADRSGARSHRLAGGQLLVLCLTVAGALAAFAVPALAAQTHPYTGTSFGPDGVGGTASFERVQSLAVDPANGDAYVYDGGAGKVYRFNSAGAPVNFSATGTNAISGVGGSAGGAEYEIALAPAGSPGGTAGDIYVANNGGAIHVYSAAGAEIGELDQGGETCGVATDPSGNFYAGVYSETINKYTPSANPPTAADKSAVGTAEVALCNVAADGLGNVYAATFSGGGLYKLEGVSDTTPTKVDLSANTMAIAPGSNDLYANRGNEILQYDASGKLIGSSGAAQLFESHGVAVNPGATKLYAGTPAKVKIFGAGVIVPDAITDAATAVDRTSATLHGTIGAAGGPAATCVFQYATADTYTAEGFTAAVQKPCNPAGPFTGAGATAVSADANGLLSSTEYRFRILASSPNGENGGQVLEFTTPPAVNVQTAAATLATASTATLNGAINPEGVSVEECSFEYGPTTDYGQSVPCAESEGTIGTGSTSVPVHAELTELTGGTKYHFRLVAANGFGTSKGEDLLFQTGGPTVISTELLEASATGATVGAEINPNGEETTYFFQYVSDAGFQSTGFAGAERVPAEDVPIGDSASEVEVSEEILNLAPSTTYHVRVIALSSGGTTTGKDFAFTTYNQAADTLPDSRAYEQVSPTDKNGASVAGEGGFVHASPDGNRITYASGSGIPGTEGSQQYPTYLASRGSDWSTQGLLPNAAAGSSAAVRGWDDELSKIYDTQARTVGSLSSFIERDSNNGTVATIAGDLTNRNYSVFYVASTRDAAEVIFESTNQLTTNAIEGSQNVYMWERSTNTIHLVGVLNDQTAPASGTMVGSVSPNDGAEVVLSAQNVVSNDGSRVVFNDVSTGQLYIRENPTQEQSPVDSSGNCTTPSLACTVPVSASQKTNGSGPGGQDPAGPRRPMFQAADASASTIYFSSAEQLTDNATTGEEEPRPGNDLYEFDLGTGQLIDRTVDTADDAGADVRGVIGAASDGSRVFFAASGVLTAQPNGRGELPAASGCCNLYLLEGSKITFVSRLDEPSNWSVGIEKSSRVTSDGEELLFRSTLRLTAYDNQEVPELYRYSASDGDVVCVSCNPSQASPKSAPTLTSILTSATVPSPAPYLSRNMSSDGTRVFFETTEKLVSADINGEKDVYEWEASNTGSCGSSTQGCLYLLSTGKSSTPSYFADADDSGRNAFIFTGERLVSQDKDQLVDLYDARVDGGISAQNPGPPGLPCEGAACRGPGTESPTLLSPGSTTYVGPGNSKPSRKKHRKRQRRKHSHSPHHKTKRSSSQQKKRTDLHRAINRQGVGS